MMRTTEQPWNERAPTGRFGRWLAWFGCVVIALFVTGCGLMAPRPSAPKATVESFRQTTNRPMGSVSMIVLHAEVMRFADNYAAMISQASDDFAKKVETPAARLAALKWKLSQATAAYVDASGPHPVLNSLDLVVLATVARMVIEDYGVGEVFGEAALPLLETHRRLETNAWSLVKGVLKPEQRQELADMIQKWREENPHQRYVGGIRFGELAAAVGKSMQQTSSKPTSVFSLLFIDPLASMDPTAAALQEARYSAERAVYYGQRMPQLLNWQVELLVSQLADQPESKQILSNAQRLVSSVEILSETSKQLPQQLTNLFVSEERRVRDLLGEARQTLSTGHEMAASVNAAIKSLDEFVRFVTPTNSTSGPSTNSQPFNVLDYGRAAAQVAEAARELNGLLNAMNKTTPHLAKLSQEATDRADWVLNRAFRLGLILILVFLAGLVLAGLIYRALVNRLTSDRRKL
jgi:hypothetical protein